MNHTTSMESQKSNESLVDLQAKITAALQSKVLTTVEQNKEYRQDLESVSLSIELLDRLSRLNNTPYESALLCKGYY